MPAKEIVSTTPDILRSVIKMDRSNVVTGPTDIMGIVGIVFPQPHVANALRDSVPRKRNLSNPAPPPHAKFLPRDAVLVGGWRSMSSDVG
jgi:hypothetical protein